MATKIYGTSDDLIEFEGDVYGEVCYCGTDDSEKGLLIICSDGTLLEAKYGKAEMAIWGLRLIKQGKLYSEFKVCNDPDDNPHSDIMYFHDGLKWAYAATEWELVH